MLWAAPRAVTLALAHAGYPVMLTRLHQWNPAQDRLEMREGSVLTGANHVLQM
jgi:hypothetical protein